MARNEGGGATSRGLPRLSVLVIGGGVTGLSAAHELVERGFKVIVLEPREDPLHYGRCQVGGMARTQWSRFPSVAVLESDPTDRMCRSRPPIGLEKAVAQQRAEVMEDLVVRPGHDFAEIRFARDAAEVAGDAQARVEAIAARIVEYAARYVARDCDGRPAGPDGIRKEMIYVEGFRLSPGEAATLSRRRAAAVRDALARLLDVALPEAGQGKAIDYVDLQALDLGAVRRDGDHGDEGQRVALVRVAEIPLAGEHGYRFFPAFYKHLFDTMYRIPLLTEHQPADEEVERHGAILARERERAAGRVDDVTAATDDTRRDQPQAYAHDGGTVWQNLIATEYHSIANEDGELPVVLSRLRARSLKELLTTVRAFYEKMGFDTLDMARYQLKLVEYMTSCTARRERYQDLGWKDFIGLENFSETFREAMNVWPQALVGMRAGEADARTAGNITVQILLDQLREFGFTDGTLNGPTSIAWLDPWRRYLESEGVTFFNAKLQSIHWTPERDFKLQIDAPPGGLAGEIDADYLLFATPPEESYRLFSALQAELSDELKRRWFGADHDLGRLLKFLSGWRDQQRAEPDPREGPFRHFNGIQFYLEDDFRLVRGHTYYANSPWGLSSISQAQFRAIRLGIRDEHRGVLSIDVGNWVAPGHEGAPRAWDCSPQQFAEEVWRHVDRGTETADERLPEPLWYHIDDEVHYGFETWRRTPPPAPEVADGRPGVALNETPYLVNLPGAWTTRPGGAVGHLGRIEYELLFTGAMPRSRGMILAGPYMKTHTRLGSMEAANESARHAVNRILRDCLEREPERRVGQMCEIFPLEERELPDLDYLKDLDAKLVERGLPHLFEILQLEALLGTLDPGDASEALADWLGELVDKLSTGGWQSGLDALRRIGAPSGVLSALAGVWGLFDGKDRGGEP